MAIFNTPSNVMGAPSILASAASWQSGAAANIGAYSINTANVRIHATHSNVSFNDSNGKLIVSIDDKGIVKWDNDINIDEAAKAFSSSLIIGSELAAGITYSAKQRMRDAVFIELIDIASEKGSLTADDLTYLHRSAKIIDKLKDIA